MGSRSQVSHGSAKVSLLEVLLPQDASQARARRLVRTLKVAAVAVAGAVTIAVGFTAAVTGVWLLLLCAALAGAVVETFAQLDRFAASRSSERFAATCAHVYVFPSPRR